MGDVKNEIDTMYWHCAQCGYTEAGDGASWVGTDIETGMSEAPCPTCGATDEDVCVLTESEEKDFRAQESKRRESYELVCPPRDRTPFYENQDGRVPAGLIEAMIRNTSFEGLVCIGKHLAKLVEDASNRRDEWLWKSVAGRP